MFETAEIGNKTDKETFKKELPKVRNELLETQRELAASNLSVVVIVGGVEGAGKAEVANSFLEWMDARGIETHAVGLPSDEEGERPPMWRFWRMLPPKGRMGIFLGSWYTAPIVCRVFGECTPGDFNQALDRIVDFETMLSREGVLVIKFWLHLKEDILKKRTKELESDPLQSWRVTKIDKKFQARYDKFRRVSEQALMRTSTGEAPWHIIEAADARYRALAVAKTLLASINERLSEMKAAPKPARKPDTPKAAPNNILRSLDLTQKLDEKKYEKRLEKGMAQLNRLSRRLHDKKRSMILVFEGPDAAGKGGAIRRLTASMDARQVQVVSVAAPTDEERAHPYLWRFWRNLPRQGKVTIYDRSWYGRVLVERVEGFCTKDEWQRAFAEINAFEECLTEFGTIVIKFWLAISPEEQLRRFKSREVTPYKQYKITEEDWRNRAKWNAYEGAAVEMIEKTSTAISPWVPIEAEDKLFARVRVMEAVISHLKKELR